MKWSDTMRGKFKYPYSSSEGKKERREYKLEKLRAFSKERYARVRGTELKEKFYPSKPMRDRFSNPGNYALYKAKDRIMKRIERLKLGRAKTGLIVRCDCGKEIKTCIQDPEEINIFRELTDNFCALHL